MKDARLVAFETLCEILKDGAYSNLAVDKALSSMDNSVDKAFASHLVYGVIERRLTLDALLAPYLKTKPKPKVKIVLYLGAYQLLFMQKVPASAAVNTAVELAKTVGLSYYAGFINAVLHQLADNGVCVEEIENRSVRYSCPEHLIRMWDKMYGTENTDIILSAINEKPPVFAVPNTRYLDADELVYEFLDEGVDAEADGDLVRVLSSVDVRRSKAYARGLFHIEDKSAYECALALDAQDGDVVLDVCAAPGGKTFTIAQRADCSIYAYDLYEHRTLLIKNGAERLGLANVICATNDASIYNDEIPTADRILCDVPCSGFGIIRRKPEIRYKELDSVKELPDIQYNILDTSSRYLKTGGTIVYATCTLNQRENEKVVQRFLEKYPNFQLQSETTVFPTSDGGDGFYYAVIVKEYD